MADPAVTASDQPPPPAEDEEASDLRHLDGGGQRAAEALAAFIAAAHIYFALFADVAELTRNAFHFAGFAVLCALDDPLLQRPAVREGRGFVQFDLALGLTAAAAALYLAFAENAIYARGVRLSPLDWAAGIAVIVLAIEFTRRTTGWIIPILIILALTYVSWWGSYVSGVFAFKGLSAETVMFRSIYGDDAMFGTIARISSTYVFLFIIFGAFLVRSGAGKFVIHLAQAVAGRLIGGPGLVAVIASALTGTISGSAVANTASTGVITIPLMKRAGFPARFAAAVEASASTGGQLMPPIMGAGAFVMASFTQIPYETIIAAAALPAILYFASVGFFVRIEARRQGLKAEAADGPGFGQALRDGGASFLIPIAVLIGLLIAGFTPTYAAVIGIGAVILSSWLTTSPMGPKAIYEALVLGARNMILTAILLCAVGLMINVIVTVGIGNTFSLMISQWSGGSVLIAIILIGLASLVLGMGLPVTAAYIVLATLSAPALAAMIGDGFLIDVIASGAISDQAKAILMLAVPDAAASLGQPMSAEAAAALFAAVPLDLQGTLRDAILPAATMTAALLSAHMIIFWLSQDSNVTPPVCLAAFTAAAIAKTPPMATGFASWKVAKGLYIVPVLFAYGPILTAGWGEALAIFVTGLVGVYGIAAALEGWMEHRLAWPFRLVALAGGIACLWPLSWLVTGVGVAAVLAILALNLTYGQRRAAAATA
jgi:TRAP transporter 4TM/12TM fusion protein